MSWRLRYFFWYSMNFKDLQQRRMNISRNTANKQFCVCDWHSFGCHVWIPVTVSGKTIYIWIFRLIHKDQLNCYITFDNIIIIVNLILTSCSQTVSVSE